MTTTITLKTHSWPVDVTITDKYGRTLNTSVETVEPNSERTFHITDTRSIQFTELPTPANPPAPMTDAEKSGLIPPTTDEMMDAERRQPGSVLGTDAPRRRGVAAEDNEEVEMPANPPALAADHPTASKPTA